MLVLLPVLWPRVYLVAAHRRRQLTEGIASRSVARGAMCGVCAVCQAINL
jgi:hypothetical protein